MSLYRMSHVECPDKIICKNEWLGSRIYGQEESWNSLYRGSVRSDEKMNGKIARGQ